MSNPQARNQSTNSPTWARGPGFAQQNPAVQSASAPMEYPGQANGGQFPGPMAFPGGGRPDWAGGGRPEWNAPRHSDPMPPPAMMGGNQPGGPMPMRNTPPGPMMAPQMPPQAFGAQRPPEAMNGGPVAFPGQGDGIPDFVRQMMAPRFNRG